MQKGWLSAQPDDFKNEFIRVSRPVSFKPGQYIYHAGDDAEGIYGILDGAISAFVFGIDDAPQLATILQQAEWFGIGPFFTNQNRTMSVVARENCRLLHVALPALRDLCRKDPDATRRIGEISLNLLEIAARVASDLLIRRTDKRIAATLLRISGYEKNMPETEIKSVRITQQELADISNCSRAKSNRVLLKFSKNGWLKSDYSRIQIIKPNEIFNYISNDA